MLAIFVSFLLILNQETDSMISKIVEQDTTVLYSTGTSLQAPLDRSCTNPALCYWYRGQGVLFNLLKY